MAPLAYLYSRLVLLATTTSGNCQVLSLQTPPKSVAELSTTVVLEGKACWFVPKPFLFCPNCGVVHDKKKNEFTKLSRLSSEGRSTATTLLCLSTVNRLKSSSAVKPEAAKILSFTDNR